MPLVPPGSYVYGSNTVNYARRLRLLAATHSCIILQLEYCLNEDCYATLKKQIINSKDVESGNPTKLPSVQDQIPSF